MIEPRWYWIKDDEIPLTGVKLLIAMTGSDKRVVTGYFEKDDSGIPVPWVDDCLRLRGINKVNPGFFYLHLEGQVQMEMVPASAVRAWHPIPRWPVREAQTQKHFLENKYGKEKSTNIHERQGPDGEPRV